MIISSKGFKKLMRESWKENRLHVQRPDPSGIYVGGTGWFLYAKSLKKLANKDKAAIIELCGDLPDPLQGYLVGKDQNNQIEMTEAESGYNLDKADRAHEEFVRLGIRIGTAGGKEVFYSKETGAACMVRCEYWDMLTSDMAGAAISGEKVDFLYFEDDDYIFAVYACRMEEDSLEYIAMRHMQAIARDVEAWKGRTPDWRQENGDD